MGYDRSYNMGRTRAMTWTGPTLGLTCDEAAMWSAPKLDVAGGTW